MKALLPRASPLPLAKFKLLLKASLPRHRLNHNLRHNPNSNNSKKLNQKSSQALKTLK